MPVSDRLDIGPIPTEPDNVDQKPVFGGLTELVKDAFVLELRHFLKVGYSRLRSGEFPRIDKYAVALDVNVDPLATAVNLIRSYPDITENMPLVAVLTTTGQNLKLGMSDKYVGMVVPCAKVVGGAGPFNITNMNLSITTCPSGTLTNEVQSRFSFPSSLFVNAAAATLDEVIKAINLQALYCTAQKINVNGTNKLALRAGGHKGTQYPNKIKITGGNAITALGFTLNQTDQNFGAGKVVYDRHCLSANLTVGIEIVCESENTRTEISDLIFDFFAFVMSDRQYQFYGRSIFSNDILDETYQIILKDSDITLSGEQESPRANDAKDKIYVNRINVPVTAIQYTDRIRTNSSGQVAVPLEIGVLVSDTIPEPN